MRPPGTKAGPGPSFLRSPFFLFVYFVLVNACLSYAPFPAVVKGGFFLLLFVPWLPVVRRALWGPASPVPFWEMESFPSPSPWALAILFLAALGVRLYGLTTIPVWPMNDEGATSFFGMKLLAQWHWNLFFDFNHHPPLFFWLVTAFFSVVPPSLFSLWLMSALVSIGTLIVGYFCGRRLFSGSFTFLWAWLWAFSFWPLYIGRFCIPPVLVPLLELGCWILLTAYLRERSPAPQRTKLLFLGIGLGLGSYLYFSWPLVALACLAVVIRSLRSRPNKVERAKLLLWVGVPMAVMTLPLLVGYSRIGQGFGYLNQLWAMHEGFTWSGYLTHCGSFFTALFWGAAPGIRYFAYKPVWGGFLNPFLGSFFFIGLTGIFREWKKPWARWWLAAFLLFMSPIFVTNDLEMFRVIEVLPLLLFLVGLGIQRVVVSFKKDRRMVFLAFVLLGSTGLDLYHLGVLYPSFWRDRVGSWESYGKMPETYRAYGTLKALAEKEGPGLLLTESTVPLEKDPRNKSLVVACYPFDASRNKGLDPGKASWAALFATTRQLPWLKARFPGHGPILLGNDLDNRPGENYFMVLVPLDDANRALFERWTRADRFLEDLLFQSLCPTSKDLHRALCEQLLSHYPLFQGEAFLESHYWPILFDQAVKADDRALENLVLKNVLRCGCVSGKDLWTLGVESVNAGNFGAAETAFRTAHRMDPSLGVTASTLEQIHQRALLQKDPQPPQARTMP